MTDITPRLRTLAPLLGRPLRADQASLLDLPREALSSLSAKRGFVLFVDDAPPAADFQAKTAGRDGVEREHAIVRMVAEIHHDRHSRGAAALTCESDVVHIFDFDHEMVNALR